ncbi:MAG TPA: Mur ligase domain-containing protein [Chitinispirillaceae bacterium]|nr:Mur ligase domain-containing protein [Chitinispirillaceae bacterium]
MSLLFNNCTLRKIHFIGIFGSGMSALAQYLRYSGCEITGSDRFLFSNDTAKIKSYLLEIGCSLFEQNGSGIDRSTDAVCISTAIENDNPDIKVASELNIPVVHRSDLLAAVIKQKKTIAIAGTSGKSTVTAMVFEFLQYCGKKPSLISGASLLRLEKEGSIGNAFAGESDLLVVEADESDGTLVKYQPYISLFLNLSKDHKPIPEIKTLFSKLSDQSQYVFKNGDDPNLYELTSHFQFGISQKNSWHPDSIDVQPLSSTIRKSNATYTLPLPGLHNALNCAAALSVCEFVGCASKELEGAVKNYMGVARRFALHRTDSGIVVIDDFAHNPEKIKAAVSAAHGISQRVLAVYQPHGFGPTRFLKNDYAETFRQSFKSDDILILLPIYYAGGTAQKDISSSDLVTLVGDAAFKQFTPDNRSETLAIIKNNVRSGDCVLVMGARDPSLPAFVQQIIKELH